jgi:prophage antirepressor-like protein
MDSIVKFACEEIGGAEISCMMVKGEPWFCGVEVATVLGYKKPRQTIWKMDLKYKSKFGFLLSMVGVSPGETLSMIDRDVSWINEAGLYKLVLKSTLKSAEIFQDWVCMEVLPSIRKTGSYNNKYYYSKPVATKDEVRQLAIEHDREDALHYRVVDHIRKEYPDAVIHAGLGEHLTTQHAGLDAKLKGYTKGEPDITIMRKLPNGFQNVLAIELKNPNGKGKLDDDQINYHKLLKDDCNIETIVDHEYDKIIIQIALHYQEVFTRAKNLAITDKPQNYDFSKNPDPRYWCNKLKNKQGLVDECAKRQIPNSDIRIKTNREIASILITFDTKS